MEKLLANPSFGEAEELVKEYISRPFVLQLAGLCSVNYQGRAKSKLDRGERLVIVKQDNSLLVHGPENYQPKNWQPETDSFNVWIGKDELVIESTRNSPKEVVTIRFEELDLAFVTKLVDRSEGTRLTSTRLSRTILRYWRTA